MPEDIKEKLLRLMDVYQVNCGAIDIIVSPEGEIFFPGDQFGRRIFLARQADQWTDIGTDR